MCVAALMMSGCVMMVFAATKSDPCAEKYKTCSDSCAHTQSQSQLRGVDRLKAENDYKQCMKGCEKAKADCDPKAKKP